jgi:flavin-dependent dehydrogenase
MMIATVAGGVAFLLALGPVWATPLFVALALLARTQALGPVAVGTLVGTVLANPLAHRGYQVGEALGFPFLGMWGGLVIAVLAGLAAAELLAREARKVAR